MNLTIRLCFVPRLRMNGAVPSLLHKSLWCAKTHIYFKITYSSIACDTHLWRKLELKLVFRQLCVYVHAHACARVHACNIGF